MTQIPNVNSSSGTSFGKNTSLNEVDVDDFLKLMIAELQNQDPLNPLDNDELIAQFSQIRSVGATEKLTSTLESVLLGQNISSATNLIGAEIDGISDDGDTVTGVVERVTVAGGQPKLHLDLRPRGAASPEAGEMEAGQYEYRVVWEQKGQLYGLDPLMTSDGRNGAIAIGGRTGVDEAVKLSNLPATTSTRRVYRREVGDEQFKLVGTITDNKTSTYVDAKSKNAATTVLTGSFQAVTSQREFEVSLKNVGEIRPPQTVAPVPSTDDDEIEREDYRPGARPALPSEETDNT